eukprot:gene804-biopygen78
MILHQLCRKRLAWDDPVPDAELQCWQQWLTELQMLRELSVDRYFKPEAFGEPTITELHHFSDASEAGRLKHAALSEEAKNPAILPKQHHIFDLIIRHYNNKPGHSGIEYVLSLIRERFWIVKMRQKWQTIKRNVTVDDIVLVVDESLPRRYWPLGRVVDVTKGRDELVLSVRVKTAKTELVQSLDKLCLFLEAAEEKTNSRENLCAKI